MYPLNQFIVSPNPFENNTDIESQLKKLEEYKAQLSELNQRKQRETIWDKIDKEVSSMTDVQKQKLIANQDYAANATKLQAIVQDELLKLVRDKIENTANGKALLENQLDLVKKLKEQIINDTNREMDLFNRFREYSKMNPNITYDEFLKNNL